MLSFLVRIVICCSRRSIAERSLKIMRKTRIKPVRMTAFTLPSIPISEARVLLSDGKTTTMAIPPQTNNLAPSLRKVWPD